MQVASALTLFSRGKSNTVGEHDPHMATAMRFIWTPLADQVI
jgi:hypothetical protein